MNPTFNQIRDHWSVYMIDDSDRSDWKDLNPGDWILFVEKLDEDSWVGLCRIGLVRVKGCNPRNKKYFL